MSMSLEREFLDIRNAGNEQFMPANFFEPVNFVTVEE